MARRNSDRDDFFINDENIKSFPTGKILSGVGIVVLAFVGIWFIYDQFRIEVKRGEMAIIINKTGRDLPNSYIVAPTAEYKGVQKEILTEGRKFKDPFHYDWMVIDQFVVPNGKLGVVISRFGEELENGEFLAKVDDKGNAISKGILPGFLKAGRHAINPYMYDVQIQDFKLIPAGYRGVVTKLAGKYPKNPNGLLVEDGERGVQKKTLGPERKAVNPYVTRISLIDCRTKRFDLAEKKDMGFPSKDGFWISLDGIVQFRVMPEKAAEVYVTFNDNSNGDAIYEEIVNKIILPNARSFCRLEGSSKLGREFIEGSTRIAFQDAFLQEMKAACEPLGIEIKKVLITKIRPPQKIASPVRERELALQQEKAYQQQIKQQEKERSLAETQEKIMQKQALIKIEQQTLKLKIEAEREQEVAITRANQELAVSQFKLDAAKDTASALLARGKAEADVIGFQNLAAAAGWKRAVEAFNGDGDDFARYILYQKLSVAYRDMMVNTADSPLMTIFESFTPQTPKEVSPAKTEGKQEPVESTQVAK